MNQEVRKRKLTRRKRKLKSLVVPLMKVPWEEIERLEFGMCVMRETLSKAEKEKINASFEAERLLDEMELLSEDEKKKAKVVEDMALELKEIAKEATQAKERVRIKEIELDGAKNDVEKLRKLLYEAKQETDLYKNTVDRLRLEAEDTFLAWNAKVAGFVGCVKRAEEEREITINENDRLRESFNEAERMIREARGETYWLREVLKQAVEEANSAKDENFQLKDRLAGKEEVPTKLKHDDKDEECGKRNENKAFNFNLEDLKLVNGGEEADEEASDFDFEKAETLKSLIFDKTPKSGPQTQKCVSSNLYSALKDGGRRRNNDDYDCLESGDGDSDSDQSSHRKMSTMLRRVGDLLMIRRSVLSTE